VFSLDVLQPSKPLRKVGLRLPDSLRELRLDVYLSATGDTQIELDLDDADEQSALKHAPGISRQLRMLLLQVRTASELDSLVSAKATSGNLPPIDLPTPELSADGHRLKASASLSQDQTLALLRRLESLVCTKKAQPSPGPSGSSPAVAASSSAGAANPVESPN
jgi:hypothetical protein